MRRNDQILLTGRTYKDHCAFWKKQLSVIDDGFAFTGGLVNRAGENAPLKEYCFEFDKEVQQTVAHLSHGKDLESAIVCLSAFVYLLARLSNERLVVVKSPLLRNPSVEKVHADEVILVTEVERSFTIKDLLLAVQRTVAQSYKYQNYPLSLIHDEEKLRRWKPTNVFFNVPAVHRNHRDFAGYDLVLELDQDGRGVAPKFFYNPAVFDELLIESLATCYRRVVEAFGQLESNKIELVSPQESERLLHEFNDTAIPYPSDATIHELFAAVAVEFADQVAVSFKDRSLTYRELNEHANQLAHHLRNECGVETGALVGLLVERSERMIVAILAILKAGAAYVPVDVSDPQVRIAQVLHDARAQALLIDSKMLSYIESFDGPIFELDLQLESLAGYSTDNVANNATANDLAYVMYTSGSTGIPKGVQITHRGVVRLVKEANYVTLSEQEVVLQMAPLSFDASTFEIWGALLNGARLVLMPEQRPSLDELAQALEQQQVTTLWLTASLFNLVVDENVRILKPVRQLLAGGDALSLEHVRRVRDELPGCELINGYGPTESTTFACCYHISAGLDYTTVPIGRPVSNTEVYVLDDDMRPVPTGVAGELYIGGDGLARGYHHLPALTAEKFIPNPFSRKPGACLFKTGDRARHLATGSIEFLGRKDHQVKLRGFRIELEEIEFYLSSHPAVSTAIVQLDANGNGEKRLVAAVVQRDGEVVSGEQLRLYLGARVPAYMIPAVVVALDHVPLTANGKLDRQALRKLAANNHEVERVYVAPRTENEQKLADCWASVLKRGPISIDDNFFTLGGDSMHAIQAVSRARQSGLSFSIQDLFESQTIRELASVCNGSNDASAPRTYQPFSLISADDRARLPADVEDAYPLTMLQQGMLFHSEYTVVSAAYQDVASIRLSSRLDVQALAAALRELVERHAILRTSFDFAGFSEPLQLVHREASVAIIHEDLRQLSLREQDETIARLVQVEQNTHFDWTSAPLLRVQVHERSDDTFQFTLSFHHAILDGWSLAVLLTEFLRVYKERLDGRPPRPEPPLAGCFRDFVARERETLAAPESKEFWLKQLDGFSVNTLPHWMRAVNGSGSRASAVVHWDIPEETADGLRRLANTAAVPLKSVFLAAHLTALKLMSGEPDVLTGVVMHGRPESVDGERVLGLFLNAIPFRQRLVGGTWLELVRDVFANELGLLPFSRRPLLQIQNDLGGVTLFDTAFNFVHFRVYQSLREIDELEILDGIGDAQTNFSLTATFQLDPFSSAARLLLHYDPARLSQIDSEAIGKYYASVMRAMALDPTAKFETGLLVDAEERRQQLQDWTDTARDFPRESSIAEQFEQQVAERGAAAAVVYGDERLSYRELNERANQLAHYLKEQGVGAEVVVGVSQERSVDLIVSLLGILKAGGAYLPLDPEYPEARREYMAARAGAQLVLRELPPGLEERSGANLARQSSGDNVAYVMYTSGSTGRPKGIAVTQGNVLRLAHEPSHVRLGPEEVMAQASTASFDAATFEIWSALLNGARLVGVSREELLSAAELSARLRAEGVTVLFLTTALFKTLAREPALARAGVKQLLFGGERADVGSVLAAQAAGGWRLINLYGPTEVTVCATWYEAQLAGTAVTVPIGRPLNNTEVYVLDERGELLPVGVVGELYVGGAGLARGYVADAAQTAERFVPHPFAQRAGARLYRTGDLGRWNAAGELEFVGRVDEQVKLRGYRIEPGEIEQALREHEAVQDAVVVVASGAGAEPRLVGYVVAAAGAVSVSELQAHLRERLPEYMVPRSMAYLERLPLKANGKVDHEALPEPARVVESSEQYVGPRTATEAVLCELWREVLRVERVGVHDNFFALGGDSILSIQIAARARQRGWQLTPKQLFQYQRVSELAALVSAAEPVAAAQGVVTGAVGLTPIQHWFFEQEVPEPWHWNQALVLESGAGLDEELLQRSWGELVKHHDGLRSRFRRGASGWRQELAAPSESDVGFASYDLRGWSAAAQREWLAASGHEQQRSLDLERGPLVRVGSYALGAGRSWLLLVIHHLVVDGVSWRILLEDLQAVYEQLRRGAAVQLPAKSSSLVQWGEQLQAYADSSAVGAEAEYWVRAGAQEVPRLRRDYGAGENTEGSVAQAQASLSEAETQALLQEVPGRYQTEITEVLVTALVETLWRWSGERLVRVALEGHGREELGEAVEVTRTVGWFTSLYPAVLDLRQVYEVGAMLRAVKEQLRAIPGRGLGYGLLRYLGADAGVRQRLQEQAAAELSFNYLGQFDQVLGGDRWLRGSGEAGGAVHSAAGRRRHLLDIGSSVAGGQLHVTVQYSRAIHSEARMAWLMQEYVSQLRRIIEHCRKQERASYTPSDFPQARLSQSELESLLVEIGESNK